MSVKRVGINPDAPGITVRGIRHLTECVVAMFPEHEPDNRCTCWDDSPDGGD